MQDFYGKLNNSRLPSWRVDNLDKLRTNPTSPMLPQKQIRTFNNNLQWFYKYVREIFDTIPDISNEEMKQSIQKALIALNVECANTSSFRSNSLRVDTCNYFKEHPSEFRELYKKLIAEEQESGIQIHAKENVTYSSNKEQSKRQLLEQLITSYRKIKGSFSDTDASFLNAYANSNAKTKRLIRESQTSKEVVDFIVKNEMFFINEEVGIIDFFKAETEFLTSELKKDYISSLKNIFKQLNNFNFFQKYTKSHNKQVMQMDLSELVLSDKDIYDMRSKILDTSLSDLSLTELSSLNAFWLNRLTKEITNFNNSFFTVTNLDLWDSIRTTPIESFSDTDIPDLDSTYIDIPVFPEEIDAISEKIRFLSNESVCFYNKFFDNTDNDSEETIPSTDSNHSIRIVSLLPELNNMQEEIGDGYSHYFSTVNNSALSNSNNNFFDDFNLYHTARNIICNSYNIKSNIMIAQLSALLNNTVSSKNWGISLEKGKNPKQCSKVVIAIDVPGFNMPLRLHMQRELLEDFLRANQNTSKIPLYQGENDFNKEVSSSRTSVITTPVLLPVSKEYKQNLKKLSDSIPESNKYHNFIKHLDFISNSTPYPEHLKSNPQSKKKKR